MNSNFLLHLPGIVHTAPDADALYDDLAHALMGAALEAAKVRGVFHLALSGGTGPIPFFVRLMTDPRYRPIPWNRAHLWMVDERCVPPDDNRSNWKMIKEHLADHIPARSRQLHPIPVMEHDPAGLYEQELRRVFADTAKADSSGDPAVAQPPAPPGAPGALVKPPPIPRLDFVLLGMGDDAHTASLFPHSAALNEQVRLIASNTGPAVTPPPRVTMTYPLLNAARSLAALVVGTKKTPALRRVAQQMKQGPNPQVLPITGIQPAQGQLAWYLDQAAAEGDGKC